jgi:hypothetical protein
MLPPGQVHALVGLSRALLSDIRAHALGPVQVPASKDLQARAVLAQPPGVRERCEVVFLFIHDMPAQAALDEDGLPRRQQPPSSNRSSGSAAEAVKPAPCWPSHDEARLQALHKPRVAWLLVERLEAEPHLA